MAGVTQLQLGAWGGLPYGDFSGRTPTPPVIVTTTTTGAGSEKRKKRAMVAGRQVYVESDAQLERLRKQYDRRVLGHRSPQHRVADRGDAARPPAPEVHDTEQHSAVYIEPYPQPVWATQQADDGGSFRILAELERSLHARRLRRRRQEEEALMLLLLD